MAESNKAPTTAGVPVFVNIGTVSEFEVSDDWSDILLRMA